MHTKRKSNFLEVGKLSDHLRKANLEHDVVNNRDLYKIILIKHGHIKIKIGDPVHKLKGAGMYFLAPGQVSRVIDFDKQTEGYCVAFDTDYFLLCLKNQVQLCFYPFFQIDKYPLLHLTKSQWEKFESLLTKIAFEYQNRTELNDDLLTKLYLNVLLIEIERLYKLKATGAHGESSRKKLIASRFRQLVEKNFLNVRKVSEYAGSLFISPNYLNDTVREVTGQSASEVIQDRIILEAKAQLVQTELTVNEIAYQLQFHDTSYFCRFFRKHTGASPQVFRETNHF